MSGRPLWASQLPSYERPKWRSQRPATPPSFFLSGPDDRDLDAIPWTRATTRSVTDYQGNVWQALSGEVPWQGYRRVQNLFSSSSTLSTQGVTVVVGATYVVSFYGTGSIAFSGGGSGSLAGTGASTRVYTTITATTTTLTCTVTGSVTSAQCQLARPGQTTPDEYVSNGVLSTPYHGAKVDGVKYFPTDDQGRLIDGTRGYDRAVSGAWVESSSVTPIAPGLSIDSAQTNRITASSDLSGWTPGNSPTVAVGYDAQVGVYTRLTLGSGAYVYKSASGFTASARTEAALMARVVAGTGTLSVQNAQAASYGKHDVAPGSVSATRFERIDRFHSGVTVATEFSATSGGNSGVLLIAVGGSVTVDVALVTQVEAQRVQSLIYSAGSATTKNADAPTFTMLPTFATQNEGTLVADFVPLFWTLGPSALYFSDGTNGYAYKNNGSDTINQYDTTTASSFGSQVERTRTKLATSWQTGVGRYGYRDGTSKFAATAYDGAWAGATLALGGPQLLRELSIYPTALTATQLQALSS